MALQNFKDIPFNRNKPWLILGKGSSFNRILDIDLNNYNIFGLNHVCKFIECRITNIVDIEVFNDLTYDHIIRNTHSLVLPYHPHYNCKVSKDTIHEWKHHYSLILEKNKKQSLYFYNLSTWKGQVNLDYPKPIIKAKFFSAEIAFQLLGYLGVKQIYSLGLDGGKEYADCFLQLGLKPLTNTRSSFNEQFEEIKKTVREFKIDYQKL